MQDVQHEPEGWDATSSGRKGHGNLSRFGRLKDCECAGWDAGGSELELEDLHLPFGSFARGREGDRNLGGNVRM